MRKLSLILFLMLCLISPCFADQTFTIGEGTQTFTIGAGQTIITSGAAAPSCPSGTYLFAWNGDYGSDTDKGCFTSGITIKDGTQSGGTLSTLYGRTGVGFGITASDQYVSWPIVAGDGIDVNDGTVWLDVYVSGAPMADVVLFECYVSSSNYINIVFNTGGHLAVTYRGNNTGKNVIGTTDLSVGWNTIAYSWQRTGTDKHSSKVNAEVWEEETESLSGWSESAATIIIGEKDCGGAHTDIVYIDNVYILSGYQIAHP